MIRQWLTLRWFRWAVVAPLVVAVAYTCTTMAQLHIDGQRDSDVIEEELLYLPNEKLMTHFTAGLSSIVADLLWLRCIQYLAREFENPDSKFTWLEHMLQTITRLDPHFTGAYEQGGTLLAALGADEAAEELLRTGAVNRPDRWEIPFEIAKIYILNRRDQPGAQTAASYYLTWTAELSDEPDFFLNWAYNIQLQHNLIDSGRLIWLQVYENSRDDFMRELAEQKLRELDVHEYRQLLNEAAETYALRVGSPPETLADLVTEGLIDALPEDPLGGDFFIDPDGEVQSTSLLDMRVERRLQSIRGGVERYQREHGEMPESLDILVESGTMRSIPPHPYPDRDWEYDSITGEVHR